MNGLCAERRRVLLQGGGWLLGLQAVGAVAQSAQAAGPDMALDLDLDASDLQQALAALGSRPAPAGQLVLGLPDAVDNGALVPVTVSCQLPGVREIYVLVEANPQPLAACFSVPPGTDAWVSTRIRLAGSGRAFAVVRTDTALYAVMRTTQVSVGGCG